MTKKTIEGSGEGSGEGSVAAGFILRSLRGERELFPEQVQPGYFAARTGGGALHTVKIRARSCYLARRMMLPGAQFSEYQNTAHERAGA